MIQLPLYYCIGRASNGNLALGIVDTPRDFFDTQSIIGGAAVDAYAKQNTIDRIEKQLRGAAKFKAPISLSEDFAVTYQEAEEVVFFLRDPKGYHEKASNYFTE